MECQTENKRFVDNKTVISLIRVSENKQVENEIYENRFVFFFLLWMVHSSLLGISPEDFSGFSMEYKKKINLSKYFLKYQRREWNDNNALQPVPDAKVL